MPKFKVAIVDCGNEILWREYWINSGSEGSAEVAPHGLGQTVIVEADSVAEAVAIIERDYPKSVVMLAGVAHTEAHNHSPEWQR